MNRFLLLLPITLFSAGCAARYHVGINGFSATGENLQIPKASSIRIVQDANAPNPFLEEEIGTKIGRLLSLQGYSVTTNKADYYLLFAYGIDVGRTITGLTPAYHPGRAVHPDAYGSYDRSSFSAVLMPGYITYIPYAATFYTRWLVLELIEGETYRNSGKAKPLWVGEVTSVGPSSDLRQIINYMVIGAFEHFGENTGKRLNEVIVEGDERVRTLTGH